MASRLKKGDRVVVLSGSAKGQTGELLAVYPKLDTALVRGVNVVVKNKKRTSRGESGRETKELPLRMSKLALVDPDTGKATRVGFRVTDGVKVRYAKKTGVQISG